MRKIFSSHDAPGLTQNSERSFLEELRGSFGGNFAYDKLDWPAAPAPSQVSFQSFLAAAKTSGSPAAADVNGGGAATSGPAGGPAGDPVSLYTSNADIPIHLTGEVVVVDEASISPQTAISGPLISMDDFRADARFAGVDGSGYTIAVLDTGIDLDDPFFGPDLNNDGLSDRIVYQYDFADGDGNAGDYDGHGSNVASIAASSDGTYTGMAPGADIAALKVFSDDDSGHFGYVEQALQWVIANAEAYNIVSVNMSLGDLGNYDVPVQQYGIADELATLAAMDVVVVSSSGNDFYPFNSLQGVSYPSADPNSLSVGAVYSADVGHGWEYLSGAIAYSTTPDQITPFSQRDDELSDIFAPGASIVGAGAGTELVEIHGTSQAAPHIAGIVAVVQELATREVGRKLTFDEIQALLEGTGDTIIDGDDENDNVTNTGLAFQRVNMLALGEAILAFAEAPVAERPPSYFQVAAVDKSAEEGDSGSTGYSFVITRSGDLSEADSVDYAVTGSGTNPASAGDFLGGGFPSGSVTFAAGETTKTVTIQVAGDSAVEPNESFELVIVSVPPGGQIVVPGDSAIIENDDSAPGGPVVLVDAGFDGAGDLGGFVYRDDLFGGDNATYARGEWNGEALTVTLGGIDNVVTADMSGGWETSFTLDAEMEVTLSFLYRLTMEEQYEDNEFGQVLVSIDGGTPIMVAELVGNGNGGPDETTGEQTFEAVLGTLGAGSHTLAIGIYNNQKTWRDESTYLTLDDVRVVGEPVEGPPAPPAAPETFFAIAAADAVKAEGDAGSTAYTFTVTRSGDTAGSDSVDWYVTGNAIDGSDFAGGAIPGGVLAFAVGETSKTLTIHVAGDSEIETDEGFGVVLANPSAGAAITTAGAAGVILDDDTATPSGTTYDIAALSAENAEGDSGLTSFTFTVTRSGDLSKAGLISYAVSAGETDAGDFAYGILPHGAVFFAAGEASKTITLQVVGDEDTEGSEDFAVTLFNALGGAIGSGSATGTIVNDEPGTFYEITALDAAKPEGDLGPRPFTFTVTRSGDTEVESSVDYRVYSSSANGADFLIGSLPGGTVTFAAGEVSKTLTINIVGDTGFESNEIFSVTLSNPSLGSEIVSGTAQGTILNDDPAPPASTFSIHTLVGSTNDEGNTGTTPFTFMVQRYGDTSSEQSVDYAVTGGVADFYDFAGGILPSGTVTFGIGEVVKTITIDVAGDVTPEGSESFTVSLSNPTGDAGISSSAGSANGKIYSDETVSIPSFAIESDSPFAAEGDAGSSAFSFTVTRKGDPTGTVSVDYVVSSDEADASDFAGGSFPSGTVVFVPGEISKTLTIDVAGDAVAESHEAFTVTLTNPSAGTGIARGVANTIIVNDDATAASGAAAEETAGQGEAAAHDVVPLATPTTFIGVKAPSPVEEGNSTNSFFELTVTRSGDTSGTDLVDYVVRGIDADAADFADGLIPSGTVVFAPGERETVLRLEIAADTVAEMDETFQIDLLPQSPTAVFNYSSVNGTILNDDPIPASVGLSIEVSSGWTLEKNSGLVEHKVKITRSGDLSEAGWADYVVSGYGGSPADADDFVGGFLPQGRVHFLAGEESKAFSLYTVGDRTDEASLEEFSVAIVDTSGDWFLLSNNAVGGIVDDDPAPLLNTLSIAPLDAVKAEGDGGTTTFSFEITRGGAASGTTTAHYQVYDKRFFGDVEANDFAGGILPSGTVVFADGETSKIVNVEIAGDTDFELFEEFVIRVYADEDDTQALDIQAVGVIQNDDNAPGVTTFSVSATDAVKAEGDSGSTPFIFTVTRSGDTSSSGWVDYRATSSLANGGARANDFEYWPSQNTELYFAAGETSKTITLYALGDTEEEGDETFSIVLSNPSFNATISTDTAQGIILNDDVAPAATTYAITATDAVKAEGDDGTTVFSFLITRSGDTSSAGSVEWANIGGSADISDFQSVLAHGTKNFSPGQTTAGVTISVRGDLGIEDDENFFVMLSNPSGDSAITTAIAEGIIINDDLEPAQNLISIQALDSVQTEGDSGTTYLTFEISRTGDLSTNHVLVFYQTTGAGADVDDFSTSYMPGQSFNFSPGEDSRIIYIPVAGDNLSEGDESFTVTISTNSADTAIDVGSASGTILDDDTPPLAATSFAINALDASKGEGSSGTTDFTFTVTRSGDISEAGSVDYAVYGISIADAEANDFADGILPSGTVNFASGEASKTLTIEVQGDTRVEGFEDFTVVLRDPSSGSDIAKASASGTIRNDDSTIIYTRYAVSETDASKAEGDNGATTYTFAVARSGDLSAVDTVNFDVFGSGENPASATDFIGGSFPSGTVTFDVGETRKLVTVEVAGDSEIEPDENFIFAIRNPPDNGIIDVFTAEGTIINDDVAPPATSFAIAAEDAVKAEGDAGTTAFTFTVTRSGDTSGADSVDWGVSGASVDGADFVGGTLPGGTVSFAAGETSKTLTVEVAGDTDFEPDEAFTVTLSNPSTDSEITTASAEGTILNDDPAPPATFLAIAAEDAVKAEGDSGSTPFTFTVTRSGDTSEAGSVDWAVSNTEVTGSDFLGGLTPSGTVTFAAGEASKTLTVNVAGDLLFEDDEPLTVTLFNASSGSLITTPSASGTILNDDAASPATFLSVAAQDAVKDEGDGGTTTYTFAVWRSGDTSVGGSVDWAVTGGDIDAGDFPGGVLPSGTVTFVPNEIGKSFTVEVSGDTVFEGDESFTVTLSNPSAESEITVATAEGTILNDDPAPPATFFEIAAEAAVQAERDDSSWDFTFTVTRSGDTSQAGSVDWSVSGTEVDGADFAGGNLPSGTVSFTAGEASKTFSVLVAGDTVLEDDEDFTVTLSNPSAGSAITTASAQGTILNDDPHTFLAIAAEDAAKSEGNDGTTSFTFTVTRSGDTSEAGSVEYAVSNLPAPIFSNPVDGSDFAGGAFPDGTVNFAAGETSKTITVEVAGDTDFEDNESFIVTLSNPSAGSEITTASAQGTIVNDDVLAPATFFAIAALDATKAEGDSGATDFTFTVTRSGDTSGAGSVAWAVDFPYSPDEADHADFFGGFLPSGTVTFGAGETSKTITVEVDGDLGTEVDESFTVRLSNPSDGAAITVETAQGTILNDDAPPLGPVTVIDEGFDSDSGGFAYEDGSFGGVSPQDFADGTWADGALKIDLGGIDKTTATDMSGGWTTSFTLDAESDVSLSFLYELMQSSRYEKDEYSQVLLSVDGGPAIVVDTLTGDGNKGDALTTGQQTFSIALGTLAAGDHSLTIGGYNNKKTWTDEFTEIVIDDVTAVATPLIPPPPVDTAYAIATGDAALSEGDTGTTAFTFTVTRSGDLIENGSVDYTVIGSGGLPVDGDDFLGGLLPSGTVVFDTPGEDEAILIIEVAGDSDFEGDESFTVVLSNPAAGGEILDATAEVTILNDDSEPTGPVTLVAADFDNSADTGGFVYSDGVFGGADPQPDAAGSWNGGALLLELGGGSSTLVTDMSGAWEIEFTLAAEMDVSLAFSYELLISTQYESDEYSQLLLSLDGGAPLTVAELFGDGNGGPDQTTGLQDFALDLGLLETGTHSLAIGGYNNKKTWADEFTEITIDDVLITGTLPTAAAEASPAHVIIGGGDSVQSLGLSETELLATAGI